MFKLLAVCSSAILSLVHANYGDEIQEASKVDESPKVGDWFEANWFDDLVKIPLTID